jgi:hypothetical protein
VISGSHLAGFLLLTVWKAPPWIVVVLLAAAGTLLGAVRNFWNSAPCLATVINICNSGYMDNIDTIAALAALAQPTRLDTFQLLVSREPDGVPAGELARLAGETWIPLIAHSIIFGAVLLFTMYAIKQAINAVTVMNDLIWQSAFFESNRPTDPSNVIQVRRE